MVTLQKILSTANNHTGLTTSMLNIFAPNNEYVVITFSAPVEKGINVTMRYDCDIFTQLDANDELAYMTLLNEITTIFNKLQYKQHAACDFVNWRLGYINSIRKHVQKKPPLLTGSIENRNVELTEIFNGIESTVLLIENRNRPMVTVTRRGTKEISVKTRVNYPISLSGDLSTRNKVAKVRIPYLIEDNVEFYHALLKVIDVCRDRADDTYNVTEAYKVWRNNFIERVLAITNINLY